jgi:hypothetical protein
MSSAINHGVENLKTQGRGELVGDVRILCHTKNLFYFSIFDIFDFNEIKSNLLFFCNLE